MKIEKGRRVKLKVDLSVAGGQQLEKSTVEYVQGALKKFKSARFVDDRNGPEARLLLKLVFSGDEGKLRYFGEQVALVNRQINEVAATLFPSYRLLTRPITWRLTETVNENLHVDVYNDDLPDHHLRMFLNLDVTPRIWHTSYTLEWMLQHKLHLLAPDFVRTATPGRICHDLNFAVFGGFETAGREGAPKHIAFFEPGELWLVDSRKVSHQIFYGRKALSTDFAVEVASMVDPSKHYYALVERYRAKAA